MKAITSKQSISALFNFANALALALFTEKMNALPLALMSKRAALFLALFYFFLVLEGITKI